jgi:hypothetical protein
MGKGPRAAARCGARALVVATVAAGGLAVMAAPAYAAPPTITSVFVAGSTTNKVVTAGTTVVITGTGFTGMVDNNTTVGTNTSGMGHSCSGTAPATAWPTSPSGCSQVRFLGVGATNIAGFTLATRYTVVSDTTIYATVPTITPLDGTTGSPAAGTGSIKVQVLNTTATAPQYGLSASATSELFYRGPITATVSGSVTANPNGGGTIPVAITVGDLPPMTTSGLFTQEKITAYLVSAATDSPQVAATTVTWKDADEVNVTLPPGSPAGNNVSVMLVHDGVAGVAAASALTYPAVITSINSCSTAAATVATYVASPTTSFPTCTGSANAPTTGDIGFKVTGKGLTGATNWSFDGTSGNVTEVCAVISDTTAYCHIDNSGNDATMAMNAHTAPPSGFARVTFTPAAVGTSTAPSLAPTAGALVLYGTLV